MRETTIKPGDKFSNVEDLRTVWVVAGKAELVVDTLPHFHLTHEIIRSRTLLMSASALLDTKLFKRVED